MSSIEIFPLLATVYPDNPKKYISGIIYNKDELENFSNYCTKANIYYSLSYLLNEETTNNLSTTTGDSWVPAN